jgi:hypothetical protein
MILQTNETADNFKLQASVLVRNGDIQVLSVAGRDI